MRIHRFNVCVCKREREREEGKRWRGKGKGQEEYFQREMKGERNNSMRERGNILIDRGRESE